jgi:hypothetical protein
MTHGFFFDKKSGLSRGRVINPCMVMIVDSHFQWTFTRGVISPCMVMIVDSNFHSLEGGSGASSFICLLSNQIVPMLILIARLKRKGSPSTQVQTHLKMAIYGPSITPLSDLVLHMYEEIHKLGCFQNETKFSP